MRLASKRFGLFGIRPLKKEENKTDFSKCIFWLDVIINNHNKSFVKLYSYICLIKNETNKTNKQRNRKGKNGVV